MKKVVILRGIPGAGKTTAAKQLFVEQGLQGAVVFTFSADHYFEKGGKYVFNYKKLGEAHGECLRGFTINLADPGRLTDVVLVVDNTHTTVQEMLPYVRLAQAFGVPFEVVTVKCLPEVAYARGLHGVPLAKIYEMHRRLVDARIPKDWPHRVVNSEVA